MNISPQTPTILYDPPQTESLKDINLETELIKQYKTTRDLYQLIAEDETVPPNQKSQIANSVTGSLARLAELQIELYNSERFKRIELALIKSLSLLPEHVASKFLDEYEKLL